MSEHFKHTTKTNFDHAPEKKDEQGLRHDHGSYHNSHREKHKPKSEEKHPKKALTPCGKHVDIDTERTVCSCEVCTKWRKVN